MLPLPGPTRAASRPPAAARTPGWRMAADDDPLAVSLDTLIAVSPMLGHALEDRARVRDAQDPDLVAAFQRRVPPPWPTRPTGPCSWSPRSTCWWPTPRRQDVPRHRDERDRDRRADQPAGPGDPGGPGAGSGSRRPHWPPSRRWSWSRRPGSNRARHPRRTTCCTRRSCTSRRSAGGCPGRDGLPGADRNGPGRRPGERSTSTAGRPSSSGTSRSSWPPCRSAGTAG
jgi:hypothetical protein